jgi:hypothetical protein
MHLEPSENILCNRAIDPTNLQNTTMPLKIVSIKGKILISSTQSHLRYEAKNLVSG